MPNFPIRIELSQYLWVSILAVPKFMLFISPNKVFRCPWKGWQIFQCFNDKHWTEKCRL